jgi:hypothetical protein
LLTASASGGSPPLSDVADAVVQLRIEVDQREVVASSVLVRREDGPHGAVLYFLTSEYLLQPASDAPPLSDLEPEGGISGDDPRLGLAVLRIRIGTSPLIPADVTFDPPKPGESFLIVTHTAAGDRVIVPQEIDTMDARAATGTTSVPWPPSCIGSPAFTDKGVFGIVSVCEPGMPPRITLVASARALLRRLIPGFDSRGDGAPRPSLVSSHLNDHR